MPNHLNTELTHWMGLLQIPKLGLKPLFHLKKHFPSWAMLFQQDTAALFEMGLAPTLIEALKKIDWTSIAHEINQVTQAGGQLICLADPNYPSQLKQIAFPPPVLTVKGDLTLLNTPQIAMVGSRNASIIGLENAEYFAYELAKMGLTITSGLARGVDAASHQGALKANGRTIAVMGTGLQTIYPASHRQLAAQIAAKGLLVTELSWGTPPKAHNFPRRNRLISGFCQGVLVVEASLQSGSLITARYAAEQGREVFAIPGSIHNPCSKGCHFLLRQGAKLVETVDDILEELHGTTQTKPAPPIPFAIPKLCENEQKVYDSIDFTLTNIESIIGRSGLVINAICPILISLELKNIIKTIPGGYIRSTKIT